MRTNANTAAIDEHAKKLARLPANVREAFKAINQKAAMEHVKRANKIAPRSPDAPHLAATIKMAAGDPRLMEYIASVGGPDGYWVIPVEFGHVNVDGTHTQPNPFWVPLTRIMNKLHKGRSRRAMRKLHKEVFGA